MVARRASYIAHAVHDDCLAAAVFTTLSAAFILGGAIQQYRQLIFDVAERFWDLCEIRLICSRCFRTREPKSMSWIVFATMLTVRAPAISSQQFSKYEAKHFCKNRAALFTVR